MGYIHDSSMRYFVPPSLAGGYGGTWTHFLDAHFWYLNRAASSGSFQLGVPVAVPHQNANENRGSRVASLDVYYSVYDADMVTLTPQFCQQELPAAMEFQEPTHPAFSYDALHDTNAERIAQGSHVMTLTLTTALWVQGGYDLLLNIYGNVGAVSIFRFWGAQIRYTLRI